MIHDFYDTDPKRGFYGGGGSMLDSGTTRLRFALGGCRRDAVLGEGFARDLAEQFTRSMFFATHGNIVAVKDNCITLDPSRQDAWGLPCMRVTTRIIPTT